MAHQLSIEEQVAQLTEEEKNKILKIGKVVSIIGIIIIALMILWCLMGCYLMMNLPLTAEINLVQMELGIIGGEVIGFAAIIAMLIFVKVKYPFYSDKKLIYIKKSNQK